MLNIKNSPTQKREWVECTKDERTSDMDKEWRLMPRHDSDRFIALGIYEGWNVKILALFNQGDEWPSFEEKVVVALNLDVSPSRFDGRFGFKINKPSAMKTEGLYQFIQTMTHTIGSMSHPLPSSVIKEIRVAWDLPAYYTPPSLTELCSCYIKNNLKLFANRLDILPQELKTVLVPTSPTNSK